MANRLIGSIFAVAALLFAPTMGAQTAQQLRRAKAQPTTPTPDLSGVWKIGSTDVNPIRHTFTKDPAPMQSWAEFKFNYNNSKPGQPRNGEGRDELDPRYNCFPPGPTVLLLGRPFEIVQSPRRVLILHEWDHWVRQIWTDGREHPETVDPTWMGHSVGRWDGDTLVVDTVGLHDKTWVDNAGTPHSDALHLMERFRRIDDNTLEIEFLFDDPKAFTKPWGGKKIYELLRDGEIYEDVVCEEMLMLRQRF